MKKGLFFLFSLPLVVLIALATIACPIIGLGERIDLKNPECAFTTFENQEKIVSGSYVCGKIRLQGSCSDDIGVTEVYIGIGSQDNFTLATLEESKNSWYYDFDTTTQVDGEIELFLKAKDAYGREGLTSILLIVDNTAPIIVVDNAQGYGSAASDYKIAIKGEAADNFRIKSVEITTDSSSLKVTSLLGTFSWSGSLKADRSGIYNLTITATDYAGNRSSILFYNSEVVAENESKDLTADEIYRIYTLGSIEGVTINKGKLETLKKETLPINVNLDDDIPKLSVSNMSSDPGVVTALGLGSSIIGRVFDDDAVNANTLRMKFDAPFDENNPNDGMAIPTEDITGFGQQISFVTSIPIGFEDGNVHQLYLSVKDIQGVQGFLGPIAFKVNIGAPILTVTSHQSGDAVKTTSLTISGVISDDEEPKKVECYKENTKLADGVLHDTSDPKKKNFTIDLSGLVPGNNNLRIVGSDNEFSISFNLNLFVDTTPPEVFVVTPKKEEYVNGLVTVRGNFSDNYLLKKGYYIIGKSASGSQNWVEVSNLSNFSFEIPTQEFEGDTYAFSVPGSSSVRILPIRFKAIDIAGNEKETDDDFFFLRVDNQLDRPSLIIIAPANHSVLGGSTTITGSAFDDEAVHAIYMQIDCNGDGLYNSKFNLHGSSINSAHTVVGDFKIANETNIDEFFEDESLWYKIPGDVNPWKFKLNQRGEFYNVTSDHTGKINIRVVAQDTKDGMTGDIFGDVKTLELTFDNTIPFIENVSPDPKKPIHKTIFLEADFYDRKTSGGLSDEGIKNIEISYNNGVNWTSLNGNSALTTLPGEGQHAGYDRRHLKISIDTTDTVTYPIISGQLFVKLKVVDLADYISILPITYSIDNTYPEATITSPDLQDQVGTAVQIQGTATDAGRVAGVVAIHLYFTDEAEDNFIKPSHGSTTTPTSGKTKLLKNGTGAEAHLIYPADENYLIKINSFTENGMDTQAGIGDNDGFPESLSLNSSTYHWWARFDSTKNFSDGRYKIHYVVFDTAGNGTYYQANAFIKNNKPVLSGFAVGTDINGDGKVENIVTPAITEIFNYDAGELITGRNKKAYVQFNIVSNNQINKIELLKDGTNILPQSVSNYENTTNFTVQATIDTSGFTNETENTDPISPIKLTCKVVDKEGISVTQDLEMHIKNYSSNAPTIAILKESDRFSMIKKTDSITLKKLLTPNANNTLWQYTSYGETESQDSILELPKQVQPTVVGNLIDNQLSGNMFFLGEAKDDQRIKEIFFVVGNSETKILQANSTTGMLESCHANCEILTETRLLQKLNQKSGQAVYFVFEWEAKTLTPVTSISAGFKVVDFTGGGQSRSNMKIYKISPYITEIETELSKSHHINSFFGRSATGKYPVRQGETITINGWNFGSNPTITINGDEVESTLTGSGCTVAINKDIQNGKVEVTSNSISSKNGENNTLLQTKEPNLITNDNLDNSREIFILVRNPLKPDTTRLARYPRMKMLKDGVPIFVFADGSKQVSTINPKGDSVSHNPWETSYTQYYVTDLAFPRQSATEYTANDHKDAIIFTLNGDVATSDCGTASLIAYGHKSNNGNSEYQSSYPQKRMIESIRYKGYYVTERTTSPSLHIRGPKNNAHIYLTYYDAAKNVVRYRYGRISGLENNPSWHDGFETNCSNSTYTPANQENTSPNSQTIAEPEEAGAYTALAIHPNGKKAAVFWYDAATHSLKCKTTENAQVKEPAWGDTIVVDSDYAGQYVDADFNGDQIGCAYYTSAKGDLCYAVLPSIKAKAEDVSIVTVDSHLAVGTNIDLEYINGKPYISYFNNSYIATSRSIKMAYQITQGNGANSNELYTGNWEIYTIPCISTPKNFTVSIGNQNGKPCVGFASDAALEYWTLN